MAEIITMPRLSDTMEEGTVAKWLKKVGDKVAEGDILAEIETDKATMEFESFYEGTLLHIGIEEGDGAPVDALLAIIGAQGEDISGLLDGKSAAASSAEDEKKSEPAVPSEKPSASASQDAEIPQGVEIITMPRLSDTMEEGTVAAWLKKVGDAIEEGDILAEIETDKATMEFESFYSGTLLYIGIQESESAPVDAVLAIIGPKGTDITNIVNSAAASGEISMPPSDKPSSGTEEAAKSAVADTSVATQDLETASGDRIFVSPLARKIASEKGIDLKQVTGSGDSGRIVKRDIENFVPLAPLAVASRPESTQKMTPVTAYVPAGEEAVEEVKNSQMRKVIAKRLSESKFSAPHYYLTIEVDMEQAMASRGSINTLPDTKVSFNDMVVKACAMALRKHPQVNTSWSAEAMKYNKHIHIGVAVAVDEGLVVPVLKYADQMSLTQIGTAVKDLAGRARTKKIAPAEMEGSTFTVSNLGMFGILEFTSIINQPNSAILSVGAIVEKPVVRNGEIAVGHTMKVTLACDHRTVDGATGSQFLQTLRAFLEHPVTMLA
jgi:pyruvate dehydrogenase E2 component (dihydrolipoamide acetyltransferase)